jgi:hypothetical protein
LFDWIVLCTVDVALKEYIEKCLNMLDMARRRRWIDRIVSFASKDKLFEIEYSHILIIIIIFYAYVLCYLIKILSKLYGRQVGRRAYGPIRRYYLAYLIKRL